MPTDKGFSDFQEEMMDGYSRTNHLLAIGINAYEHCPELYNAVKDVQDFVDLMVEKYDFESEYIYTLFDKEATEANILNELQRLATTLTPNDNLIIYFSGHGEYNKTFREGYWIPVDANRNSVHDYISNSDIRNILSAIPTHHTFLIADSCFSGALFMGNSRVVGDRLERDASRWGLTSGKNEIVSDGKIGTNSPFAASLLYQLKHATKPLGVQELCFRILEQTVTNAEQTPLGEPLKIKGHKNGQFVFRFQKDEARDWLFTQNEDTIESYESFLINYPNSQHKATAEQGITKLKDTSAWKQAIRTNTINSYIDYKMQFPSGIHYQEASEKIAGLEDEKDWQVATSRHTISAYFTYIKQHPNGQYIAKANTIIANLRVETVETTKPEPPKEIVQEQPKQEKPKQQPAVTIAEQKTTLPSDKPKKTSFNWKKMPWIPIEVGVAVLVLMLALWQFVPGCEEEEPVEETNPNSIFKVIEKKMVRVEEGKFEMGNKEGDTNEQPTRVVYVPAFYISKTEVTQKEWERFMGKNPSRGKKCPDCPVNNVSWLDVEDFIRKLSKVTGKNYRLPSEAEWEYAARGGNRSQGFTYSGSNDLKAVSWYNENSSSKTHPVGEKDPNELGLYDMTGNVWEWCQDNWHENYDGAPIDGKAWEKEGIRYVIRGGSYANGFRNSYVTFRQYQLNYESGSGLGFRLVYD